MTPKPPLKNVGASVRARLTRRASERKENVQLALTRFAIERLLYRLSLSPHRDHGTRAAPGSETKERAAAGVSSLRSRLLQHPHVLHEHPDLGWRSKPESSKSVQEPQPAFGGPAT